MEQLLLILVLTVIGFTFGRYNEKKHYRSIRKREKLTSSLPLVNFKKPPVAEELILNQKLVLGATVVSIDYFKMISASLKSIFGGRILSYESLLDRARREAILRMKEDAKGHSMIINVRIETSSISKNPAKKSVGSLEVLAYGTAITFNEI